MAEDKTEQSRLIDNFFDGTLGYRGDRTPVFPEVRTYGENRIYTFPSSVRVDRESGEKRTSQLIISAAGREYLKIHKGFLQTINTAQFTENIIGGGASSHVIHPPEFPDVVIKLFPLKVRELPDPKNPDMLIPAALYTPGIDQFLFKQFIQPAIDRHHLKQPRVLVATTDVLVEDFVPGITLYDYIKKVAQSEAPEKVRQLYRAVLAIMVPIRDDINSSFTEIGKISAAIRPKIPSKIDIAPTAEWLEKFDQGADPKELLEVPVFQNWMLDPGGQPFADVSSAINGQWLRDHLVCIDPYVKVCFCVSIPTS